MGIRPAIASISAIGDVQKAPDIHSTTLHCIFLRALRE